MQANRVIQDKSNNTFTSLDYTKWQAIIADWESSHESQKVYCERLNLNVNTFSYMRGRLLAEKKKQNGSSFVAVNIKADERQAITPEVITIENNAGFKIHLPINLSDSQLKQLLQVLGW